MRTRSTGSWWVLAAAFLLCAALLVPPAGARSDLPAGGTFVDEACVVDGNLVSGRTYHDHGQYVGVWIEMLKEEREVAES